jgi:hypothetical protein
MVSDEMKEALREVMREVLGEFCDRLSTGNDAYKKIGGSMERLSTGPAPRIEMVMGELLVPQGLIERWSAKYPDVDIGRAVREASVELNRRSNRVAMKHGYARWLEARIRSEYERRGVARMRSGGAAAGPAARATVPCDGIADGKACESPALFLRMQGAVRKNFCVACDERYHAQWLRDSVTRARTGPPS